MLGIQITTYILKWHLFVGHRYVSHIGYRKILADSLKFKFYVLAKNELIHLVKKSFQHLSPLTQVLGLWEYSTMLLISFFGQNNVNPFPINSAIYLS